MRILLHTRFYPNVGGVETVAWLLTHEWYRAGQEVTVVSDVQCSAEHHQDFPFPVYYRPNPLEWLRLMRWSEVFIHMNVSLKALWPTLLIHRPWFISHQGCYYLSQVKQRNFRERLKLVRARRAGGNIAASAYIACEIGIACEVVPNPFNDQLFRCSNPGARDREFAFVGRLVSQKGADLLIRAVAKLRETRLEPRLTIIGDGPQRAELEQLAVSLHLQKQAVFAGAQSQEQVARLLQLHEILVVPSLWEEGFGVVALEGAASGCVVLGSDSGGLPEAIGPAGTTFRRGDIADLAVKLEHLLHHRNEWQHYRAAAPDHLALHRPGSVAKRYVEVFERALGRHRHLDLTHGKAADG